MKSLDTEIAALDLALVTGGYGVPYVYKDAAGCITGMRCSITGRYIRFENGKPVVPDVNSKIK